MQRTPLILALVAALAACADSPVLQPEASTDLLVESAAGPPLAAAKWAFHSQLDFVQTVKPGTSRTTPSGVVHGKDLVNEFLMTGDLEGWWYFIGKYRLDLKNGHGGSIPKPALMEITGSALGTGTFECRGHAKIENYPTDDFIQYGVLTGCKGTGDFAGKKMKVWISNENDPGLFLDSTYDVWGKIW